MATQVLFPLLDLQRKEEGTNSVSLSSIAVQKPYLKKSSSLTSFTTFSPCSANERTVTSGLLIRVATLLNESWQKVNLNFIMKSSEIPESSGYTSLS